MPNDLSLALVKNDHAFPILVKVDQDDYVVPPRAWLQAGCDDIIYLSFPGDAPMQAFPLKTLTPYGWSQVMSGAAGDDMAAVAYVSS